MPKLLFAAGLIIVSIAAVWEHPKWSRVMLVIGILLMALALAPTIGLRMFT